MSWSRRGTSIAERLYTWTVSAPLFVRFYREARNMKRTVFVGALVGALAASTAFAQTAGKAGQMPKEGHTAPKPQPMSEPSPTAPDGGMALGTVHIPKAVKADGK